MDRMRRSIATAAIITTFATGFWTVAVERPRAAVAAPAGDRAYVTFTPAANSFPLVQNGAAAPLVVGADDWPGVLRAAGDLRADVARVTTTTPALMHTVPASGMAVIVGTVGHSAILDRLISSRKIDVSSIAGKWESFFLETVANPLPGIARAVVIAGSDKRGTIYGMYDLSEQIGVSPWYWWADVTPVRRALLAITPGRFEQGEPSVRYRGIFFNDERPSLTNWVRAKYGERPDPGNPAATVPNMNSAFYSRVFELLLRLKANYLWPAMWNNAFAEDDPDNPRLADEYGIVMGTSHQEPMLRAQKEWDWHQRPSFGNWNYATHPDELAAFWRDGVRARRTFENVYTIGLRGENDTPMVQGAEQSMALLEKIVDVQRRMIADEVNPDVARVPQLWCLYKEVQGYYERGLRVPDDVTLLWAEDNWGNLRRLPTAEERKRAGGAGIYYHFDYHGGPRSYQWLNTNPIAKIWDQMSLAKTYGADRIWIVNVGHFKGYELPTEYFLRLAWNADRWTNDSATDFTRQWAAREFGAAFANGVAEIVSGYSKFNGRRKPELLDATTYSLVDYQEAERVLAEYDALVAKAEALWNRLPADKRDAFYQLALFPAKASANLNALYVAAGRNALYAAQGRASANSQADRVRALFQTDRDLTREFDAIAGGKWAHFMDQPHIGYTSWADPPQDNLNAIKLISVTPPMASSLGVAVEGASAAWPGAPGTPALVFDSLSQPQRWIDVFNRGQATFDATVTTSAPWLLVGDREGNGTGSAQTTFAVSADRRLMTWVDWSSAPRGIASGTVTIAGAQASVTVEVTARNPADVMRATLEGFAEADGYVAIEAEHYSAKHDAGTNRWVRIDDYGHTLSAMRTTSAVDAVAPAPGKDAPSLEYRMYLFTPGQVTTALTVGPTLNVVPGRGLQIAVSFDADPPQYVTLVPANYNAQNGNADWERSVRNNARVVSASSTIPSAGYHTLKLWMIDPAVVVERIVVMTGVANNASSYLGPPESYRGAGTGARR